MYWGVGIAESLHQEAKSKKVPYLAYQVAYNNLVANSLSIELGLSFLLCMVQRFCKPQ